jgi:hypothetical protein
MLSPQQIKCTAAELAQRSSSKRRHHSMSDIALHNRHHHDHASLSTHPGNVLRQTSHGHDASHTFRFALVLTLEGGALALTSWCVWHEQRGRAGEVHLA